VGIVIASLRECPQMLPNRVLAVAAKRVREDADFERV
jgi:hypothetical protein